MPLSRRKLLQFATLLALPLLQAGHAFAGQLRAGFEARDTVEALKLALGSAVAPASSEIFLQIPEVARLGAVVPITVSSSLPAVESITVLAPVNQKPLIASYRFNALSEPYITTRIKLAKSTKVMVVVKSGGKLFSASRAIQVNRAGCRI